jgi:hypothetical protein
MLPQLAQILEDFRISESNFSPAGAAIQVAAADPTRWSITFGLANTGVAAWVSTRGIVATNNGIPLTTQTPVFTINFRDYGALTVVPWFAFGGAASGVQVIEVFYRPQGWEEMGGDVLAELADRYKGVPR